MANSYDRDMLAAAFGYRLLTQAVLCVEHKMHASKCCGWWEFRSNSDTWEMFSCVINHQVILFMLSIRMRCGNAQVIGLVVWSCLCVQFTECIQVLCFNIIITALNRVYFLFNFLLFILLNNRNIPPRDLHT